MMRSQLLGSILLAGLVGLVVGCGPGKSTVSGTVTYQGTLLKFGSVTIESSAGTTHGGEIGPDGKYSISGVPNGKGRISVSAQDPKAAEYMKMVASGSREGKKGPSSEEVAKKMAGFEGVPPKFADFAQSGLTVDVKGGNTAHDIKID